ncbi:Os07g0493200, partial [Oryza sativa Japonica Group]
LYLLFTLMGDWYEQFSQSFKDAAKEMLAKTDIDPNVKCFTRKQMKRISNNYRTILGKGGFSVVYKGRLNDGRAVAVKKYNWKTQKKEFTKEVIIQSQFSHKNIVRLLGCCVEADAPMLVTEFVPNGNLSNLLHSNSSQFPVSLGTRLQIALDVAEALVYMHSSQNHPILHGDVKPSNILLGDKDVAKLCDFGISRLLCMDSDEYTGFVIGSRGYVDPVFCQTGRLSLKSDVYSFGVVLLELITKKKGIDDKKVCLAETFARISRKGNGHELFDMDVVTNENMEFLQGIGRLALECIKFEVEERPEMKEVLERLWSLKRSRDRRIREMQVMVRSEIEVLWRRCGFGRFMISKERMDDMTYYFKTVLKECASGKAYIGRFCNAQLLVIKMSISVLDQWKNIVWNELNVQSRIKHWNDAKLLGYCLDLWEGLVLVYEYGAMSLYDVLFHDARKVSPFICGLRLKIAVGAAEGLAHLHSLGIVHGNVSTVNILLDDLSVLKVISRNYPVKIAGYGTSGLPDIDKAQHTGFFMEDSLVTSHGKEHDVYCFGLVLLTLFTWKKVSLQEADTVFEQLWDIGPPHDVNSEPEKPGQQLKEAILRCRHLEEVKSLVSRCLTSEVTKRPSMVEVAKHLKNINDLHDSTACHELAIYQSRMLSG